MPAAVAQRWSQGAIRDQRWVIYLLPSLTDFAFILPIFLLVYILGGTDRLFADGDTGWHIRTGEWILQHKTVPVSDFFSFTRYGQPWFAWEWGSDVLFALLHRSWSLAGVAFLSIVLLAISSALLFRLVRRVCTNDVWALLITGVAICGSIVHWLARPHLFTWFFLLVFSHAVLSARQGRRGALFALPGCMVLWVNLHGGFFIGIMLLLLTGLGDGLSVISVRGNLRECWTKARPYLLTAALCGLATLANPYGWHLHQHVWAYLCDSKLLSRISEFQSPNFHDSGTLFFEFMLIGGLGAAFWCFEKREFATALWILLWAHLALASVRNIPLFGLISAPYTAAALERYGNDLSFFRPFRKLKIIASGICAEIEPLERLPRSYAASLIVLLAVGLGLANSAAGFKSEFDRRKFPVNAVAAVREARFARLFTADQWADYLIYRLYPRQKVFLDGRSDFFGSSHLEAYAQIMGAHHGWQGQLKSYNIDGVMVNPDTPLASVLKTSPDWKIIFDDGSAVIFRAISADNKAGSSTQTQQVSTARESGRRKLESRYGLQAHEG